MAKAVVERRGRQALYILDVLPAHCGLDTSLVRGLARFRPVKPGGIKGPWTRWYGEHEWPVELRWEELWKTT